jgi:hypothetical protein
MTTRAIEAYHGLLDRETASASHERLMEQQARRGLRFGEQPLCHVLRPRLLTIEQYRYIRRVSAPLLEACALIHERAVSDPVFRRLFRLTPEEEELFLVPPGYPCPMPTARLDAFYLPQSGVLKFTELNAETPAAAAYTDELADVFQNLPVMAAFQRLYNAVPQPARPGTLNSLLECWRAWGGKGLPRVAILDWTEVPTRPEFELWVEYMHRQGVEARIIDPREVVLEGGKLRHGSYAIDLVYKRVLISELLERGGLRHPVFEALRSGAACVVNGPRCKALYKKASLAALSDEQSQGMFTAAQREAIAAHIPWTRVVEERKARHDGQEVDLVPFLLANRGRLVLKPNDDYGGKGVVLGWTVDEARWSEAVQQALKSPYVAQERVELPSEPWPAWAEGGLHLGERMLDTAPFVSMGRHVEGCLTRIATDPLLNVTAGGGSTVPTFVIEER